MLSVLKCLLLTSLLEFMLVKCVEYELKDIETNKFKLEKKDSWLDDLLNRKRRNAEFNSLFQNDAPPGYLSTENFYSQSKQRPCPLNCNCNYNTINCNELIDECPECLYWNEINFNQITYMRPNAFKNYKFSSNRTTHIIIYKLLNSTLNENVFSNLKLPVNSQLEITFQYNSVIKFDKNTLNGVKLSSNSTLVFNFPYTTQVIFVSKCFDGVLMEDTNSRLIIRILKSFSVRFVNDYFSKNLIQLNKSTKQTAFNASGILPDANSYEKKKRQTNTSWSIATGQFILDIKSTHLVKFEDYSFAYFTLKESAKMYLDMDLVEKLMIQRHSFSNLRLESNTKMVLYAKHITFIDFKAFSFSHVDMLANTRMQIYLEELTSSLCLQRNVFSHLRMRQENSHFNFSIINSKNVMLMHDSFSNVLIESKQARLFVGVFNMPSYLLKLKEASNYYQTFLKERLLYKLTINNINSNLNTINANINVDSNSNNNNNFDHYSGHFAPPFPISSEYFYNNLNTEFSQSSSGVISVTGSLNSRLENSKTDLIAFYLQNKQAYSYNVSIEKNCFSNLKFNFESNKDGSSNNLNIWLVADNINTLLVDNYLISYHNSENDTINKHLLNNVNFLLNVKNFVLSPKSLVFAKQVRIEFLRTPKLFRFGLAPMAIGSSPRQIRIIGLNFDALKDQVEEQDEYEYNTEQENLDSDFFNSDSQNKQNQVSKSNTAVEDFCQLAFISEKDTIVNLDSRNTNQASLRIQRRNKEKTSTLQMCSCNTIYLLLNQLTKFKSLNALLSSNILNCKLDDLSFISSCQMQLEKKCNKRNASQDENGDETYKGFVKFWEYCISEVDPLIKNNFYSNNDNSNTNSNTNILNSDTGNYYYNNFNDPDGIFSASLSSSSFFDQSIDPFKSSSSISSSSSSQPFPSNGLATNIGKIIGVIIVSFLCGIILFMIAINIIQYKFRNDLLDDLDYSSNQTNYLNANNRSESMNFNNNNNNNTNNENDLNRSNNSLSNNQINVECFDKILSEEQVAVANEATKNIRRNSTQRDKNLIHSNSLNNNEDDELDSRISDLEEDEDDDCDLGFNGEDNDYDSSRKESNIIRLNEETSSLCKDSLRNNFRFNVDYDENVMLKIKNNKQTVLKSKKIKISQDKLTNDSGKSSATDSVLNSENPPSISYMWTSSAIKS